MADIRIKDLTTTASSTASDDFIAVDGTTNGTRKLNAFSPTFGGNVVVTGTLTSNSTLSTAAGLIAQNADFNAGYIILRGYGSQDGGLVFFGQSANNNFINSNATTISTSIAGSAVSNNVAAGFRVLTTTASTTTSTGALVVGNGTSGGLGVGGSIFAGGYITSTASDGKIEVSGTGNTGGTKELIFKRSDGGDSTNFGLTGSAYAGVLTGLGNNEAFLYSSAAGAFRIFLGTTATQRFDFTSSQFKINPTTASTSTSSGALVVSGGVGVAGKVTSTALGLANTSQSATAWGDVGVQLSVAGAVLTDTSSSGTVGRIVTNSIAASALAASSTTTYTAAASLFIAGAPTANTNVTITNAYALYTAGGRINFQGLPTSSAGLQAGTLWNDGGTLKVA